VVGVGRLGGGAVRRWGSGGVGSGSGVVRRLGDCATAMLDKYLLAQVVMRSCGARQRDVAHRVWVERRNEDYLRHEQSAKLTASAAHPLHKIGDLLMRKCSEMLA